MTYYPIYLEEISFISWEKIHYLDEASFVSRNLHSNKAVAPVGEKIFIFHGEPLSETYSVTLCTCLNRPTKILAANMVTDTNSQYDFATFIIYLITGNYFDEGDVLILDNAAIHGNITNLQLNFTAGADTFLQIHDLCSSKKVNMKFLPTYSPEVLIH